MISIFELCRSEAATRLDLDNTPNEAQLIALTALRDKILEPLLVTVGPLRINSAFRCHAANKAVGGASTSQHIRGEAADIESVTISNLALAKTIASLRLPFDQLILEFFSETEPRAGWVHVSHRAGNNRGQIFTASKANGVTVFRNRLG